MSFFRSAEDVSESDQTSSGLDRSRSQLTEFVGRTPATLGASQHHQNVLVHALLEEKCLNDICNELNAANGPRSRVYTKEDPEVKVQAAQRYQMLTAQLVSHGLISAGPEHNSFFHVRQTARDGLSLLTQQLNALDLSNDNSLGPNVDQALLRQPLRRLLTESTVSSDAQSIYGSLPSGQHMHLASQLLPSHPLLDTTRYARDFEEVCMLGKGGYGSVFRVSHRLDGRSYAVKKIHLGPSILSRVQDNGEAELDAILSELRTMAKLEHPNIVRYFGGWVEWSKETTTGTSKEVNRRKLITEGSLDETSSASASSLRRVIFDGQTDASIDNGILFENSASTNTGAKSVSSTGSGKSGQPRPHTPSGIVTVTDEDIEEISRHSATAPSVSITDADPHSQPGPSLTLHIQMSLYPLTLSQYLSSATISLDSSSLTLQHCFHLPASIELFLAILSGVEHLHAHGIVHRDLKPANIFLSPKMCVPALVPSGSINPLSCRECQTSTTPSSWPKAGDCTQTLRLSVCVGDFGLVTDMGNSASRQGGVGTALYRPPLRAKGRSPEGQDMYALAIVMVELLTKFGTRMERLDVLTRLREEGVFPACLEGEDRNGLREVVGRLLGAVDGEGLTCGQVRDALIALL